MIFHNIRLIVFDLDGTLVDAFADIAAAANHALRLLGRPERPVDKISPHVGNGGRNLMKSLLEAGASEKEIDQAFEGWRAYYAEHPCDFAKPYPGVPEALAELHQRGIKLALISNKLDELTRSIAEHLGLAKYFDAIQGEQASVPRKPDPAALYRLMDRFGVKAEETLMVGDGDADMKVATNAGVAGIGVNYGVYSEEKLKELGAAVVLGSMSELPLIVGK